MSIVFLSGWNFVADSCDSVVARHQNDRLTYFGLDAKSNALARGLEAVGVKKGARVAVMLGNSIEYAVVSRLASSSTSSA